MSHMPAAPSPRGAKRNASSDPNAPVLIVGLGNPGKRYERTRHNIGFAVADELASRALPMPAAFSLHKRTGAMVAETRLGVRDSQRRVILAKPNTYMNESGRAVAGLVQYFSVQAEDVIVMHDELDLDLGQVRVKRGGGENGHNGLRSTSKSLGTKDYQRIRVGIGRPPGRMAPADYVLAPFGAKKATDVAIAAADAADAAELMVRGPEGFAAAERRFGSTQR